VQIFKPLSAYDRQDATFICCGKSTKLAEICRRYGLISSKKRGNPFQQL